MEIGRDGAVGSVVLFASSNYRSADEEVGGEGEDTAGDQIIANQVCCSSLWNILYSEMKIKK